MKFKIIKYDVARNVFDIYCKDHPECDSFDPFVSGITNGDKYLEINKSMEGRTLDVETRIYKGHLLLTRFGEHEYLKIVEKA